MQSATTPLHLDSSGSKSTLAAIAIALGVFLLFLPTLDRAPLEDDMEQLNLATALELKWSRSYALPTLQGETRLNKPPGVPWLTAFFVNDRIANDLSSPDLQIRHDAQRALAFQSRWPTHAMSALIVLCAFGLGRTLHGDRAGLISAVVCASTFLIARYTHFATFDVPLALCAAIAQLCLAQWLLNDRRWLGAIAGGAALGAGMLAKGPVIFLFTLIPFLLILPFARRNRTLNILPSLVLFLLALLPVLPWVFGVIHQIPNAWDRWLAEITRTNASAAPSGAWYRYLVLLRLSLPWTIWLLAGIVLAIRDLRKGRNPASALLLAYVIVPLIILSLARDRKPHYLLPLAAPIAVLAARPLAEHLASAGKGNREEATVAAFHWLLLAILVATVFREPEWVLGHTVEHPRLKLPAAAIPLMIAAASILLPAALLHIKWRPSVVIATFAIALLIRGAEVLSNDPQRFNDSSLQSLADQLWQAAPNADVYIHEPIGDKPLTIQLAAELELHLGRVVRWTPDPRSLPQSAKPQALILACRRHTNPTPPAGWTKVDQASGQRLDVTLFIRDKQSAP